MFSNKKKSFFKSKIFIACLAVLLLSFGIWLNYDGEGEEANTPAPVNDTTSQKATQNSSIVDSRDGSETTETSKAQKVYYLVREVEGVVKIFYCDENGKESLYEITSIPFDLLSKKDQQLFVEGVRIETLEELDGFLENFDS